MAIKLSGAAVALTILLSCLPIVLANDPAPLGELCYGGGISCSGYSAKSDFDAQCYSGRCGIPGAWCVPDEVSSYYGEAFDICAGPTTPNYPGSGYCKDSHCQPASPIPLGGQCDANYVCVGSVRCGNGICGGYGAWCDVSDPAGYCASGQCINNACTSPVAVRYKGESCASDQECVQDGVFCSPGGICGGEQAQCQRSLQSASEIGESNGCVSGFCKGTGKCASSVQSGIGGKCNSYYDCQGTYVNCGNGLCGGGGTRCTPFSTGTTGTSYDCASQYCRNNVCTNVRSSLGSDCSSDMDCGGYFGTQVPFFCGTDGKCGGTHAACQANDGTADGDSGFCVSGLCSAGFCSGGSDPSPQPILEKKSAINQGSRPRPRLCGAGLTACPVQPKGYECLDLNSDIETCGGCPGARDLDGNVISTDCTALPNVDTVACVDGVCAIQSCIGGAVYQAGNNTCVLV